MSPDFHKVMRLVWGRNVGQMSLGLEPTEERGPTAGVSIALRSFSLGDVCMLVFGALWIETMGVRKQPGRFF